MEYTAFIIAQIVTNVIFGAALVIIIPDYLHTKSTIKSLKKDVDLLFGYMGWS